MFARACHMPGHQKAVWVQHAIASAINIACALMLDVPRCRTKDPMYGTDLPSTWRTMAAPNRSISNAVAAARFAAIGAEMQAARLVLDEAVGNRPKDRSPFKSSLDAKPKNRECDGTCARSQAGTRADRLPDMPCG